MEGDRHSLSYNCLDNDNLDKVVELGYLSSIRRRKVMLAVKKIHV
jgi:hypothetical protein